MFKKKAKLSPLITTGPASTSVITTEPASTSVITTEPASTSIVTTETKRNTDFQNQLGSLARSDAHHDLGTAFKTGDYKTNPTLQSAFNSGLPSIQNGQPDFQDYHETGSLIAVMLKIGGNPIDNTSGNKDDLFKPILKSIVEVNPAQNATKSAPTICDIGYRDSANNGQSLFTYNAVKFSNKGKKFDVKTFANDFFVNTNLGGANGKEAAVIVDFAQCQFFELLASGDRAADFTVHYLMTSEMVNDPAGKPNISNKTLFGTTDGINVNSYIQTNVESISYSKFDVKNPTTSNNFFSRYDFKLSPIQQIFTKGSKSEKLISTLNISLEDGTKKPLVDTIEDSKSENSITTVLGYLRKIIQSLTKLTTASESNRIATFNFNSKCQQKRSGDWFQVLCCHDARNRDYTQILPDVGRKSFKLNPDCPVYFVTHDQIAVAYALLNGVNVIYFSHGKEIFVFKNSADFTATGSGMSVEQIYFNGMKTKYGFANSIEQLLGYAEKYSVARKNILTDENTKFTNEINTPVLSQSDKEFMKNVEQKFKSMFAQAVRLMFININLTDIDNAIVNITNHKDILNGEYNSTNNAEIITLNKSFDLINCVLDRFGKESASAISPLKPAIEKWIGSNVTKLDVYRTAEKIDLYDKLDNAAPTFDINRISEFDINTANKRATDKYIFLPFIQTLNYTQKNQIVAVLKGLVGQLTTFLQHQSGSVASTGLTQLVQSFIGKRVTGELKFYNNVANIIFESMILLDTTNEQPPPEVISPPPTVVDEITKEDILVLFSTDDVIVNEDLTEILALLNGKNSNSPDAEDNKSVQKGGDILTYEYFYDNVKGNTISDVSVRQITYPLLGNILITTLIGDKLKNFVNKRLENQQKNSSTIEGGGPNEFLLEDYNLGYHPLVPIYMLLSPFYYSLGPKYDSYPYFDTYFTYFNILNKMATVLQTNYLKNPSDTDQIADGYLIGFGLGHMLFTSNTSLVLTNAILASIEMEQSEYYNFSLKNDCLSSLITGAIHLNAREEQNGVDLLTNSIFKQFITEEVNIKQMLGEEIPSEGLTYVTLQQNVLALLKTIAAKIKNDRNPNSWEKAKLRQPTQVQGITPSQLSSVSMKTGTTSTPDTWSSLTSSLSSPIGVGTGGFLKTKKQKRKNKKNLKTKRQKNKRSNKKSIKKHRRRKQRKQTRKH